jgi:hypothetical protein
MKQTALEKAIQLIKDDYQANGRLRLNYVMKVLNEAKEMEKQQIENAFYDGCFDTNSWRAEEYYNENFKNTEQ